MASEGLGLKERLLERIQKKKPPKKHSGPNRPQHETLNSLKQTDVVDSHSTKLVTGTSKLALNTSWHRGRLGVLSLLSDSMIIGPDSHGAAGLGRPGRSPQAPGRTGQAYGR